MQIDHCRKYQLDIEHLMTYLPLRFVLYLFVLYNTNYIVQNIISIYNIIVVYNVIYSYYMLYYSFVFCIRVTLYYTIMFINYN